MNDLRNEIDNAQLSALRENIKTALHSADGHNDRLKLTIALQTIIEEASQMLGDVDAKGFLSDVNKLTEEVLSKGKAANDEFNQRLNLNNGVSKALLIDTPIQIAELQSDIASKLNTYEASLKSLIEERQKMPLEKSMNQ